MTEPTSEPRDARRIKLHDGWVDLDTRQVHRPEKSRLTPTEAKLLCFLASRPGQICSVEILLSEVWGYNSRVRTRTVSATAHRLRQKLEADPTEPRHLRTVWGTGLRFDAMAQLPLHSRTGMVGRQDLMERLRPYEGVTVLVGPGGIGKTRLAQEALSEVEGTFCNLAGCHSLDAALKVICQALEVSPGETTALTIDSMGAVLPSRGLVICDNHEHVLDFSIALTVWSRLGGVRMLTTTRKWRTSSSVRAIEVGPLPIGDGVAMLAAAASMKPNEAAWDLVSDLGGVPLSIALASKQLTVLSFEEVRNRLSQSCGSVLDWAFNALSSPARVALQHLSCLPPAAVPVGLAEAVVGADALTAFEELVAAALLHPDVDRGCLRVPVQVHQWMAEQDSTGLKDVALQAATWLLNTITRRAECLEHDEDALQELAVFAIALLPHLGNHPSSLQLRAAVVTHEYGLGDLAAAHTYLDVAIPLAESFEEPELRTKLQLQLACVLRRRGRPGASVALIEEVLAQGCRSDSDRFEALRAKSAALTLMHQYEEASQCSESADEFAQATTRVQVANLHRERVVSLCALGRLREAYSLANEAWAQLDERAPLADRIAALHTLHTTALKLDQPNAARVWLEMALPLASEDQRHTLGVLHQALGNLELCHGDLDKAEAHLRNALPHHRWSGRKQGEAFVYKCLGRVSMLREDWSEALGHFTRAEVSFGRVGMHQMQNWARAFVAIVLAELGDIAAAHRELAQSGVDDDVGAIASAHLLRAAGRPFVPPPSDLVSAELRRHVEALGARGGSALRLVVVQ